MIFRSLCNELIRFFDVEILKYPLILFVAYFSQIYAYHEYDYLRTKVVWRDGEEKKKKN